MNIGIDARLIDETGVGRYIRNLMSELSVLDTTNNYVVFLPPKSFADFSLPNSRWSKVKTTVHWHTVSEQFVMPRLFRSHRLDLVHIPYHNPPIFYGGRMILTIHDLTILHFATGKATTLPLPIYLLKRLGYWIELWVGLRRAAGVIAVSQSTKQEIMDHFHVPSEKITVTYEGVDARISDTQERRVKRIVPESYFLYVGNAYPHKNVETLLRAYALYVKRREHKPISKLVLVGGDDFFYRALKTRVHTLNLESFVVFFGPANDRELTSLYTHAVAFVFPSLMEGFGLPALEALSLGCPVIASDIRVFHEILGDHVQYVDPKNPDSIAAALACVGDTGTNNNQAHGRARIDFDAYSWMRMAQETLTLYESCARI